MHYGETVELVVRRDNISISELSRRLSVSRRSIYNWFSQENLSFEIICKIGDVLGHDFSVEFPELFSKIEKHPKVKYFRDNLIANEFSEDSVQYWKDKYINLLEKHNDYLRKSNQVAAFNY